MSAARGIDPCALDPHHVQRPPTHNPPRETRSRPPTINANRDAEDRSCLHYAAGYGHEECVSLLLEHASDTKARDANGDLPLHFAAIHGHPMCAYNITKVGLEHLVQRSASVSATGVTCTRGSVHPETSELLTAERH